MPLYITREKGPNALFSEKNNFIYSNARSLESFGIGYASEKNRTYTKDDYAALLNDARYENKEALVMEADTKEELSFAKEAALSFLQNEQMYIYIVQKEETDKSYDDIEKYLNEHLKKDTYEAVKPSYERPLSSPKAKPSFLSQIIKPKEAQPEDFFDGTYEASEKPLYFSTILPAYERSLDDVVSNLDKSFMEMVFTFADRKEIDDVTLQKRANLDRKAFSKLKCGTTKIPKKTTALALAIGLGLNIDETKDLLKRAGYTLSKSLRLDVIVEYYIEQGNYDIFEINDVLDRYGQDLLGSRME